MAFVSLFLTRRDNLTFQSFKSPEEIKKVWQDAHESKASTLTFKDINGVIYSFPLHVLEGLLVHQ
ncbi:hypothetical protein SEA_TOMAS_270 [Streptomyces phage Tomas]|uniref:Uncharacterized protein n=1 Tax=Streptomyces phage Tomas TaxID=2914443 RepID=A0AA49H0Y7_9CAUD|nr:hypothetical protein PP453_gp014 [Streptomyces phage Tomas]YP_010651352.1 hypothetical protein PP453_gp054 [Streptomyces phage Tomas]UMO76205.1 hypothetical protein SEA_TOMAS_14 [Streptomyces phage Tomas]UMO76413.1 hypothetical protein SEA_TOMAS_270 [Streptomyces phage Tomas]